jgi:hypothetical protein
MLLDYEGVSEEMDNARETRENKRKQQEEGKEIKNKYANNARGKK